MNIEIQNFVDITFNETKIKRLWIDVHKDYFWSSNTIDYNRNFIKILTDKFLVSKFKKKTFINRKLDKKSTHQNKTFQTNFYFAFFLTTYLFNYI